MRKVVVYELVSLDGVAEDPDQFVAEWDEPMDANLGEVIATQDAVILGRSSYEQWSRFWPTSDIQPFADFINSVTKYVASSRPLEGSWSNASRIEQDLVGFVTDLKAQPGADIGVHASMSVAQSLLAANVVDEVRLVTAPSVVGSGRRLFDGVPSLRLETVQATTSPTGAVLAHYRLAP